MPSGFITEKNKRLHQVYMVQRFPEARVSSNVEVKVDRFIKVLTMTGQILISRVPPTETLLTGQKVQLILC